MAKAKVVRLVCGILFQHSFSILDNWGKIADHLLYKKNSYFSPQYFPTISDQYTVNRFVENREKGHRLQLSSDNLIYNHTIQNDFNKEYERFVDSITKYLIPQIVEKYDLVVRRIGIVYTCEMDNEAIATFTSQYFKPELSEIMDCRFSKRETVPQALAFSGTDDYINKIYSVGNINDTKGVSFDYQMFFLPPVADIKPRTNSFFDNAHKAFFDEIYKEEYRA